MLPSPVIRRPRLGRSVDFKRKCPHKLVLMADGNYKCRACLKVFESSTPKIVETGEQMKKVLYGGRRR
jgi:hypothetical protein